MSISTITFIIIDLQKVFFFCKYSKIQIYFLKRILLKKKLKDSFYFCTFKKFERQECKILFFICGIDLYDKLISANQSNLIKIDVFRFTHVLNQWYSYHFNFSVKIKFQIFFFFFIEFDIQFTSLSPFFFFLFIFEFFLIFYLMMAIAMKRMVQICI